MQTNHQNVFNALPAILAYPAFLAGYRTLNEAMSDHLFSSYLRAFIEQDVTAVVGPDETTNSSDASSRWLSQFSNSVVSDQLARLCLDGASKLPTLLLPTLLDLLAQNRDVHRMAFLLAAYGHYLSVEADDKGVSYSPNEPHLQPGDWAKINSEDVVAFLAISPFASARLQTYSHFVAMYKSYRTQIAKYGVVFLLRQMAYNRLIVH